MSSATSRDTSNETSNETGAGRAGSGRSGAGWAGRRVLVTGAEGFIGSALSDTLVGLGASVRALLHYKPYAENGHLAPLLRSGAIEPFPGDVRDAGRIHQAVEGCDTVFHLAALIGIPYSYQAPESYTQTNVLGTEHVAAACLRHGARLIQTSTSEVYGSAVRVPIDETHPLQPQSPYSASKIAADMTALAYHHAFNLPVTVVRPFNTYGPRQSARAVIPTVLAQLHHGAREIKLGSLRPTRDFTYVDDTVSGFLAAADSPRTLGRTVNLGVGREISIADLAAALIDASGREAVVVQDPARLRPADSEVLRLVSDNSLMRELTGWAPQVPLTVGLERTSAWIQDNLRLFAPDRYQV
ncbi:SDR family NAD(P)-dependent oxidoreductase [Catenulispora pinisilvae]|uniref:SDR family NAD(P)-dependent oxidoreductase n=1 Tax=Catenulispora pinisilvae TaxID=2705253 RepID=UPI00189238F9|nr:SDR family NAD(P)-dependent oxidoreductase [Catenulispora pinisilvae]